MAVLDYFLYLRNVWRNSVYTEVIGTPASPLEEFRNNGSVSVRTYLCAWDARYQFMEDLLGYSYLEDNGQNKWVARITPHFHFEYRPNGARVLWATAVTRMEGWGAPDAGDAFGGSTKSPLLIPRYKFAKLTVQYETLTYDVKEDVEVVNGVTGVPSEIDANGHRTRYLTQITRPSAEYLTLPANYYKFVDGSATVVPSGPGKIETGADVSLIWHQVPHEAIGSRLFNPNYPNFPLDQCVGAMNKNSFLGCDPGQLLMLPPDIRPIINPFGKRIYDVELRMKFLLSYHYKLYQVTPAFGYFEVTKNGDTNLTDKADDTNIYNWRAFEKIFQIDKTAV